MSLGFIPDLMSEALNGFDMLFKPLQQPDAFNPDNAFQFNKIFEQNVQMLTPEFTENQDRTLDQASDEYPTQNRFNPSEDPILNKGTDQGFKQSGTVTDDSGRLSGPKKEVESALKIISKDRPDSAKGELPDEKRVSRNCPKQARAALKSDAINLKHGKTELKLKPETDQEPVSQREQVKPNSGPDKMEPRLQKEGETKENFGLSRPDHTEIKTGRDTLKKSELDLKAEKIKPEVPPLETGKQQVFEKTAFDKEQKKDQTIQKPVPHQKTDAKPEVLVVDLRTQKQAKDRIKEQETQSGLKISKPDGPGQEIELKVVSRSQQTEIYNQPQSTRQEVTVPLKQSMNERFGEILKNQVVKQTALLVKDEGKGEIRLILKPESLGQVRIKVTLDHNHIAGKFFVENNTVKQMFESNLDGIRQALRDEGFETAALDVYVGQEKQEQGRQEERPAFKQASLVFDNNIPAVENHWLIPGLINLTA